MTSSPSTAPGANPRRSKTRSYRSRFVRFKYLRSFARWCTSRRKFLRFATSRLNSPRWSHNLRICSVKSAAAKNNHQRAPLVGRTKRTLHLRTSRITRFTRFRKSLYDPPSILKRDTSSIRIPQIDKFRHHLSLSPTNLSRTLMLRRHLSSRFCRRAAADPHFPTRLHVRR